jgi:MerR family transcriptional regulator, light-induced transcriptional regulator
MMSRFGSDLTIGAVAAQTNVSVATLRAWEHRHGFPRPERLASGHRRFSARQVDQIRQVLRDRDSGWSLEAAIARLRTTEQRSELSIFAGLRRRDELAVHVLSQRAMLAISRAIEDECCAQAERPLLIGSFQRERFYRRSERRWRDLSRTAAAAIVLADFPRSRVRRRWPIEVALPPDAPLLREWAVVCDAPDAAACVAGVERPPIGRAGRDRRFEVVWSADPEVVRDATELGLRIAGPLGGALAVAVSRLRARAPADPVAMLHRATALTNRIVAYLDN